VQVAYDSSRPDVVRAAAVRVLAKSLGKREDQLAGLAGGCNVLQGRGGWEDLAREQVEGPGQVGVTETTNQPTPPLRLFADECIGPRVNR
jgi:hypothetical protein